MSNINNTKEQYELNRELAQMWCHHGCHKCRAGKNRRGSRSMCGYGIRADPGGYQSGRRCGKNE